MQDVPRMFNAGQETEKSPVLPGRQNHTLVVDHTLLDDYSLYPYDDMLNSLDLFPAGKNGDWVVCKT